MTNFAGILGRLALILVGACGLGRAAHAQLDIDIVNAYPGLETPAASEAVDFVKSLAGADRTIKVPFGTEGGLFSREMGIPTVVCGPGFMAQGHKPDEFVSIDQLQRCGAMLDGLLQRLQEGVA